jgi:hypothetical protein
LEKYYHEKKKERTFEKVERFLLPSFFRCKMLKNKEKQSNDETSTSTASSHRPFGKLLLSVM